MKNHSLSWLNYLFLGLIKIYQFFLSPWIGRQCRFTPSCSEYAKESFEKYSTGKALKLTLCRIARCHPFAAGGIDPVP